MILSEIEVRLLGALMEKEATTPESYPLSGPALLTACNQRTSREPVMHLHLQELQEGVRRARDRGLLATVQESGARVAKHRHRMREAFELNRVEAALLSVLMLRGPQTPGELRARIERYVGDVGADEVAGTLRALAERPSPLVENRGRRPGQSQDRWMHELAADEATLRPRVRDPGRPAAGTEDGDDGSPAPGPGRPTLEERLEALERRVAELEAAVHPDEAAMGADR